MANVIALDWSRRRRVISLKICVNPRRRAVESINQWNGMEWNGGDDLAAPALRQKRMLTAFDWRRREALAVTSSMGSISQWKPLGVGPQSN